MCVNISSATRVFLEEEPGVDSVNVLRQSLKSVTQDVLKCIKTVHSDMGWLRSVGSIKLQVSFAEYCLFYRALLQKRPTILSILLSKATP